MSVSVYVCVECIKYLMGGGEINQITDPGSNAKNVWISFLETINACKFPELACCCSFIIRFEFIMLYFKFLIYYIEVYLCKCIIM